MNLPAHPAPPVHRPDRVPACSVLVSRGAVRDAASGRGKSGVDYYAELVTRMGGKLVDYGLNKALPPGSFDSTTSLRGQRRANSGCL